LEQWQFILLGVLAAAVVVFLTLYSERSVRINAEFFAAVLGRVRAVLEPKGFNMFRSDYFRQSFGHRIASFQAGSIIVDLAWEGRDHEILLLQRPSTESNISAGEHLARAHIPQGTPQSVYAAAADKIVAATSSIHGAA
jgi:hypothetical protein